MDEGRLATYRRMRDFERTAEPRGGETTGTGDRFVVQRHRARRKHYDLRLEHDGALLSWAVPKGPTLDPAVRRMAVRVEDHPLEYADFEGTIPAGEYGGGDVIVWDRGTWTPGEDDPAAALEAGTLHFELHGEKLRGHFVLVRRGETQWLLLHKRDEHAEPGWDPEEHLVSVKSGRTNEQVAAAPEAMWRSDLPADQAEIRLRPSWQPPTDDELAELAALGSKGTWTLQGERIALTNLDKVLFPGRDGEEPITKRELIAYHARIAPVMLPYLADRALNSHRFPRGVDSPGFWHKEVPSHAPDWLRTWAYPGADPGDVQRYIVPDSPAALAWLANYAALELHPWTSPIDDVEHPSWALFDIDPGERTSFDDVLTLARLHRAAMEHLGVLAKPKVTGQRGIQIWVPVEPRYSYSETREWVEKVSRAVGNTVPELVSWAWSKSERHGLARLDYTQNVLSKTLVAPYSARPRPGAPVSVPLEWDELDDPDLTPDRWTLRTVGERVAERGDPFAELLDHRQPLPPV
ncbi:DNA polymerase ligase N-terminal domain-containing protein [Saccharopolyspora sp. TS4A08]|uniref:DNA polymerase ligase N-terminal domain-containing protein n=1 Tax=Saccharopolyspora ipomoeae TaxID=3042027 RepID=A0ABT6PWF4_9PSEU|nr:DNA polymerase ligase N-terminal domain-containing protein [Saccharopolyspora sp. TS4A08]MDI2032212.1 DNA polymerase ligase N-terminal domain-containing protein [Saccharopolyspora sp. TS4A08]